VYCAKVITAAPLNTFGVGKKTDAMAAAQIIESWRGSFEKQADLGADFFAGTIMQWKGCDLGSGGTCRFHDHGGRVMADKTIIEGGKCPFQATECFEDVVEVARKEAEARKKEKRKQKMTAKSKADALASPQAANSVEEPVMEVATEVEEPVMEEVLVAEEPVTEEVPVFQEPVMEEVPVFEEPVMGEVSAHDRDEFL
jgi:hypothetical protein